MVQVYIRTSVTCKTDNSEFLLYILIFPEAKSFCSYFFLHLCRLYTFFWVKIDLFYAGCNFSGLASSIFTTDHISYQHFCKNLIFYRFFTELSFKIANSGRSDILVGLPFGFTFFIPPPHDSGRVLWFNIGRPCICRSLNRMSVCLFVFHFWIIT